MLEFHESQRNWLDSSQGLGAYVQAMRVMGSEVGNFSGRYALAEGWRRRLHFGFCGEGDNPLLDALGESAFAL